MSCSSPCNCDQARANELELAAWRFLAAHRVEGLRVTHVLFTDADGGLCSMSTPSQSGLYEIAAASTFSDAAIDLAIALGMKCIDCQEEPTACVEGSSSADTVKDGVSAPSTQLTRAGSVDSTTAATGAGLGTDVSDEQLLAELEAVE